MKKLIRPAVIAMGVAMLSVSSSWAHMKVTAAVTPSLNVKFGSAEDAKARGGEQMGETSGTGDGDCDVPVPVSVGGSGIGGSAHAEVFVQGQSEGAKPAEKGFHSHSVPNVQVQGGASEKSTWRTIREYMGAFLDSGINTAIGAFTGNLPKAGSGMGSALLGVIH